MSITDRLSFTRNAELDQIERDDDTIQVRKLKKLDGLLVQILRGKTIIRTVVAGDARQVAKVVAEHYAVTT